MSSRPRFKPSLRVEVVPSEGVFLLSEEGHVILTDPTQILVAPWLTGEHTYEEISAELGDRVSPPELAQVVLSLQSNGYLDDTSADASGEATPERAAFLDLLGSDAGLAASRLRDARVTVTAFGAVDPAPLTALLEASGLRVGDGGDRRVVLTDDELSEGLEDFNTRAIDDGRPWMLVKPVGRSPWLGPVFVPGQTGCWQCLAHRRRGQRQIETYLQRKLGYAAPAPVPRAALPSSLQTALGLTATEIYKWVVQERAESLEGQVLTLDLLSLRWRSHRLVRRPQCPACGTPGRPDAPPVPLTLESRTKAFTADGGHRSAAPDAVFARLAHHVSPVTGLVSSLYPGMAGDPDDLVAPSSYIAQYGTPHTHRDLRGLLEALSLRAGGKGRTHEQARMSALGEAIERYSGFFQGDEPRIRASLDSLDGEGIHPNDCMNYSRRQYANREITNQHSTRSTWVAEPFDESLEIDWTPLHSLTDGRTRWLPTAYCWYGYADRYNVEFARANSNGCAAGSNREEAILQGFLEVVERDSVAIWWYNRLQRPGVDLDSFDDPWIHELRSLYRGMSRDLWVLDVSSDVEIPVFAAVSRRVDKPAEDLIFGFGAHLDPLTALLRALTELNQSIPPVASATADGRGYLGVNESAINWWRTATLDEHPYLAADVSLPLRTRSDFPEAASHDLRDDVSTCVRRAQARGLDTLVLDQTRADVDLAVVKVVVPGMRHFWPRLAPGRLYDVPVSLGWLEAHCRENELNTAVVYF